MWLRCAKMAGWMKVLLVVETLEDPRDTTLDGSPDCRPDGFDAAFDKLLWSLVGDCRTMYCVRENYEFGIVCVMDSVRPYDKKLGPETWYYTKRCFLSFIEKMAKQLLTVKDSVLRDCFQFLDDCESEFITAL